MNSTSAYYRNLAVVIPLAALLNPIGGLVQCLGEEIAWRGYLLEQLQALTSLRKSVLITNTLWGLWYAPVILLGFNYGLDHPILGVFAMILFCNVIGTICSYGYLSAQSI